MVYVAVALQVIFLLAAFVLRTLLHLRRTGSAGFRVGARRSYAELLGAGGITIAAILSAIAVVLDLLDLLDTMSFLDRLIVNAAGAAVSSAGIALVLRAQAGMGSSWRIGVNPGERTELVTGGLFSLSRNPIFLGMVIFWLGIALIVANALTFAAVVIAAVAVEVQVRLVEEPYLIKVHGDSYRRYAGRTGRFLPGIGKLRS